MTESTRNTLGTLAEVLLGCWILGFAVIFISFGAFLFVGGMIRDLHGWIFGLSPHEIDIIAYGWLGLMKIAVTASPWQLPTERRVGGIHRRR